MPPLETQPPSPEVIDRIVLDDLSQNGRVIEIPKLLKANANNHVSKCLSRYEDCFQRANHLARSLSPIELTCSHTQRACRSAILITLPSMLRQTATLVENLATENCDDYQSSLALDCTEKFLENIESVLIRDDINFMDQKLSSLISALGERGNTTCSVSSVRASELVFEIGIGPAAYHDIDDCIRVSVDPVTEIRAVDLLSGAISPESNHPYIVTITRCKLRTLDFPTNSERAGEAHISLKLTPFERFDNGMQGEWEKSTRCQCDETHSILQEARVCQTNSVFPRQAISADMFTSCVFGESSLDVRLVVNTFRTEQGEAPCLQITLVMNAGGSDDLGRPSVGMYLNVP
jgi:hypothetical protein